MAQFHLLRKNSASQTKKSLEIFLKLVGVVFRLGLDNAAVTNSIESFELVLWLDHIKKNIEYNQIDRKLYFSW